MAALSDSWRADVRPSPPPGPYLVAGLSVAGRTAAAAAERLAGPEGVLAWDSSGAPQIEAERQRLAQRGVTIVRGDGLGALRAAAAPRCIVKSPGIPPSVPLMAAARAAGVEVVDELELGWRLVPARLLAVTGTNGKTTTTGLALALLRAAGHRAALAGSSQFAPPLSALAADPPEWVACEVSSYQLECCPELLPDIAVLTNLTHDHLHRHGTMQAYGACKRRLFVRGERAVPLAILNLDDDLGRDLAVEVAARGGRVLTYGTGSDAAYRVTACEWDIDSGQVGIATPRGQLELRTRLPGPHNALNLAAATGIAAALGLDGETACAVLEAFEPVPGRFELIQSGQPFDVVVDLAHTPDAIARSTATARAIVDRRPGARLLVVMSTAGMHDRSKRLPMGRNAAAAADHLVVTTGPRYGEAPDRITAGLAEGVRTVPGASFEVEFDRRAAMRRAIGAACAGDIVLITGRGAHSVLSQDMANSGVCFDDREVARELLRALPVAAEAG